MVDNWSIISTALAGLNRLCIELMMLGQCDVIFGRELPCACVASSSPLLLSSIVHLKLYSNGAEQYSREKKNYGRRGVGVIFNPVCHEFPEKLQYYFLKKGRGASTAVRESSKNSSMLAKTGIPNSYSPHNPEDKSVN